ncbi:MAG: LuxR C-terminal-related transcriptional regulator [Acidobacteria bacterium]|nr:LuxR C-terminal-related transcriptional regulator [Acidobacteriota bacterium]
MPADELYIRVVSSHPVVVNGLSDMISQDRKLGALLLPPITSQQLPTGRDELCLFVVDTLTSPMRLSALARSMRLRVRGSKFLALLLPEEANDDSLLRLLHTGIEGVLVISERLGSDLREAIPATLQGERWAPPSVLADYLNQTRAILDNQILPQLSLTGRENQVLHLMIRRFSNAEIGEAIGISERTVRFHVSNIFSKLRVEDRRNLLATLAGLEHRTS